MKKNAIEKIQFSGHSLIAWIRGNFTINLSGESNKAGLKLNNYSRGRRENLNLQLHNTDMDNTLIFNQL